jgi:hypothetical protein
MKRIFVILSLLIASVASAQPTVGDKVIVTQSALPTGASTGAKQDTAQTTLSTIATNTTSIATAALQTSANTKLDSLITNTTSIATAALQTSANTKLDSLITNTGAGATAANQTTELSSLSTIATNTASNIGTTASGNVTTQNLVPAGTATTNSAIEVTLSGAGALTTQVTGTYTGALSLQGTVDGTNWITLSGLPFVNVNTGAASATITSATAGIFQSQVLGFTKARITGLAAMTGTAVITLRTALNAGSVNVNAALPTGTNTIGAVNIAAAQTLATVTTVSTVTSLTAIATSVTPGTSAAHLGKAVDSAVGGTDTGVAALVERKDTPATLTPAVADYTRMLVDAFGRTWVSGTGLTGSAVPVNASYMAGIGSANLTGIVNCDSQAFLNMTTATTTELVALTASQTIRICHIRLIANGTTTVTIKRGTGTNCGTGTAAIDADYNLTAQTGFSAGTGIGEVLNGGASANAVCVTNSAAVNLGVFVRYTKY